MIPQCGYHKIPLHSVIGLLFDPDVVFLFYVGIRVLNPYIIDRFKHVCVVE